MSCSRPPRSPAPQMKQHLINRRAGSWQSCQDEPTPLPCAPCALQAQTPLQGSQPHSGHSRHSTPTLTASAGFAWPWFTAGADVHPSVQLCPAQPQGRGSTPHRHSGTLLLPPGSSTAQALLLPKTPISFFPPQLRAGVTGVGRREGGTMLGCDGLEDTAVGSGGAAGPPELQQRSWAAATRLGRESLGCSWGSSEESAPQRDPRGTASTG